MIEVPHFEHEADEADWWAKNQDLVAEEFAKLQPGIGPSRLMQMRAAKEKAEPQPENAHPFSKLSRSA